MALLTFAFPVTGISGRIDALATTFTQNNGQAVLRDQPPVTNPNSTDQQAIRALFSGLTKIWKDETAATRSAWKEWAAENRVINRLGNQVRRSALSAYVQIVSTRNLIGGVATPTVGNNPPVAANDGVISGLTESATRDDEDQIAFTLSHNIQGAALPDYRLIVRMTPVLESVAVNPNISRYRLAKGVNSGSYVALSASGTEQSVSGIRFPIPGGAPYALDLSIATTDGQIGLPYRVVAVGTPIA